MNRKLRQRLRGIAARLPGTMGIYLRALSDGEEIAVNADRPFPMASVFKIPILTELMFRVHAAQDSLEDRVMLTDAMKTPGSGVLKELSAGMALTVGDLATLMIIISDNTATDILLERVTKEAVNARLRMCGLARTSVTMNCRELLYDLVGLGTAPDTPETRRLAADRLRRREVDPDSRVYKDERANMTTPREMGALLEQIVRPTLNGGGPGLPVEVCRQILAVMRRQQVRDRLPLFLPAAADVAHKTGSLSRVSNDAGILYAPQGQCIIAIFTKDLADDFKGRLAIGQVGRAAFEALS